MGIKAKIIAGAAALGLLFTGYKFVDNLSSMYGFNKQVTKHVEVAGGATSVKKQEGNLSMEGSIETAQNNCKNWQGNNAIFWKTEYDRFENLEKLLGAARERSQQIGMLHEAYLTGKLPKDAPKWVKTVYEGCAPDENMSWKMKRILHSELGKLVKSTYEAHNDAVSGGTVAKGDKVHTENLALINIMDKAAGRAFWSPFDASYIEFCNASAYAEFALLYSNMGFLDESLAYLNKSKEIIDKCDDDVDLGIVRSNVPTMKVKNLKGLLNSAIFELDRLNNVDEKMKYTSGWWEQVQKFNESLGGQDVCLGKMADSLEGNYANRAIWDVLFFIMFGAMGGVGLWFWGAEKSPYRRRGW